MGNTYSQTSIQKHVKHTHSHILEHTCVVGLAQEYISSRGLEERGQEDRRMKNKMKGEEKQED